MEFSHRPVLLRETIESLGIRPEGRYIDGTAGGGGHSQAIAERLTTGRLLAIDQDPDAVRAASGRLKPFPCATVRRGNFADLAAAAEEFGMIPADGVLFDLGVSSYQFDNPARGFSYRADAPLDMRMSREGVSARDVVNTFSERELADILFRYGEEKHARAIARGIVRARERAPVETTLQLAEIVKDSVPAAARRGPGHPARRTFQALRIQVNGELDRLSQGLDAAFSVLRPGGRLAVITFQSLEDRIVKRRMAEWSSGLIPTPQDPRRAFRREPKAKLLSKRGVAPTGDEIRDNPRCRSSRLRVCIKL